MVEYPYTIEIDIDSPEKAKVFLNAIGAPLIKTHMLKNTYPVMETQLYRMIFLKQGGTLCIPIENDLDAVGLSHTFNLAAFSDYLTEGDFKPKLWKDVHILTSFDILRKKFYNDGIGECLGSKSTVFHGNIIIVSYFNRLNGKDGTGWKH